METVKQSDEEYVRGVWEHPWVYEGKRKLDLKIQYPVHFEGATKDGMGPLWSAAAAFTRERLEEVRELRYGLSLLKLLHSNYLNTPKEEQNPHDHVADQNAIGRTIARLESTLADKLTGMKAGA